MGDEGMCVHMCVGAQLHQWNYLRSDDETMDEMSFK